MPKQSRLARRLQKMPKQSGLARHLHKNAKTESMITAPAQKCLLKWTWLNSLTKSIFSLQKLVCTVLDVAACDTLPQGGVPVPSCMFYALCVCVSFKGSRGRLAEGWQEAGLLCRERHVFHLLVAFLVFLTGKSREVPGGSGRFDFLSQEGVLLKSLGFF